MNLLSPTARRADLYYIHLLRPRNLSPPKTHFRTLDRAPLIAPLLGALAIAAIPQVSEAGVARGSFEPLPETETLGQPLSTRSVEPRRLFLNFDDTDLQFGENDDATRNMTRAYDLATEAKGFGGSAADRAAVVQAVRADWSDFNVAVTANRPQSGDYMMTVVGPNRPAGEHWDDVLGTAFLDCWDAQSTNDVSFAFHDADTTASEVAQTISQELAHGFGLEHVADPSDIMFPSTASGDPEFGDSCKEVVESAGLGIYCTAQHFDSCGAANKQNSKLELLSILGPVLPDERHPEVTLAGIDGMEVDPQTRFIVKAQADDDRAIDHVILFQDGEEVGVDRTYPFQWVIEDAPIGPVAFRAEAYDLSGNQANSPSVTVYVGTTPPRRPSPPQTGCNIDGPRERGSLVALTLLLLAGATRRRR